MGVEPTYAAWEAAVLPMNYIRRCPLRGDAVVLYQNFSRNARAKNGGEGKNPAPGMEERKIS